MQVKKPRDSDQSSGDMLETDGPRKNSSCFSNIKIFLISECALMLAQGTVGAYLVSVLTTLERRFNLQSADVGVIASSFEIGNLALILFVSYFGAKAHRPRLIGCGGIVMALGALLSALPEFLTKQYEIGETLRSDVGRDVCSNTSSIEVQRDEDVICGNRANTNMMYLLLIGAQVLLGIGATPVQPLGVSYIDDHVKKKDSSLYIAQGELEEKQAVSSEEQCGIESRSADRPNPSAAGMSCAPSCMNGSLSQLARWKVRGRPHPFKNMAVRREQSREAWRRAIITERGRNANQPAMRTLSSLLCYKLSDPETFTITICSSGARLCWLNGASCCIIAGILLKTCLCHLLLSIMNPCGFSKPCHATMQPSQ
ncbi:hypothetical protein JOQ06_002668, partial [Pogonophryne albipinna]